MSELISNHLVDHYVPFLPLERRHILLCIRDYLELRGLHPTNNQITAIADSLQVLSFPFTFLNFSSLYSFRFFITPLLVNCSANFRIFQILNFF